MNAASLAILMQAIQMLPAKYLLNAILPFTQQAIFIS